MDDFQQSLRRHYESQGLSPERAREILAAGRASAERRARRRRWVLALAAVITLACGGALAFRRLGSNPPDRIPLSAVAIAVTDFFARPSHDLSLVAGDPAVLRQWLSDRGSTAPAEIPLALAQLAGLGCHVLDVQGHQVSLMCFFLAPAPATTKQDPAAPDPPAQLVHLLIAPRRAFRDVPRPGERVQLDASGHWQVIAWRESELVLFAASDAPPARVDAVMRSL